MENLYELLQNPSIQNLQEHEIKYFDEIVKEHPADYKKIISYINDCFNYKSPLIVEEKSWEVFLNERFWANKLPEEIYDGLIHYQSAVLVTAIFDFLTAQKAPHFETYVAKQNLKKSTLAAIQNSATSFAEKKAANEMLTSLDAEIDSIVERMRNDQKKFGNYAGFDAVKNARSKLKIGLIDFLEM